MRIILITLSVLLTCTACVRKINEFNLYKKKDKKNIFLSNVRYHKIPKGYFVIDDSKITFQKVIKKKDFLIRKSFRNYDSTLVEIDTIRSSGVVRYSVFLKRVTDLTKVKYYKDSKYFYLKETWYDTYQSSDNSPIKSIVKVLDFNLNLLYEKSYFLGKCETSVSEVYYYYSRDYNDYSLENRRLLFKKGVTNITKFVADDTPYFYGKFTGRLVVHYNESGEVEEGVFYTYRYSNNNIYKTIDKLSLNELIEFDSRDLFDLSKSNQINSPLKGNYLYYFW